MQEDTILPKIESQGCVSHVIKISRDQDPFSCKDSFILQQHQAATKKMLFYIG